MLTFFDDFFVYCYIRKETDLICLFVCLFNQILNKQEFFYYYHQVLHNYENAMWIRKIHGLPYKVYEHILENIMQNLKNGKPS